MKKVICALLVTMLLSGCVAALAEEYVIRFDHGLGELDARHEAMVQMAEKVKERTNGEVIIDIYTNMQLGTTEDMLEQMRMGSDLGCIGDFGRLAVYIPELAGIGAPYVLSGYDDVIKLQDSELMAAWNQQLANEFGIVALSWNWCQGFQNAFTTKAAYNVEDFSHLTMRSASAPVWQEMTRTLGAVPVAMEFNECYSAIQTKMIDGLTMASGNIYSGKTYEVVDYMIETHHCYMNNAPCVSAAWFNRLPDEYKEILREESLAAGEYYTQHLSEQEAEYVKIFEENGVTVIPFEELDIEGFRSNALNSYERLGVTETVEQVLAVLG